MCEGCYEDYGSPRIINEKTLTAARLIHEIYELMCNGGNMHIVLDDWNLEDDDLAFCADLIAKGGDAFYRDTTELLALERACCDLMLTMTIEERAAAPRFRR